MLSDKKKQGGGNGGLMVVFLLTVVLMTIGYFSKDKAEEQIAANKIASDEAKEDSIKAITSSNDTIKITVEKEEDSNKVEIKPFTIETPLATYTFTNKGASIKQVVLNKYTAYDEDASKRPLVDFFTQLDDPNKKNQINFNLRDGKESLNTAELSYQVVEGYKPVLGENDSTVVKMIYKVKDGGFIEQTYFIKSNSYFIDYNVNVHDIKYLNKEIDVTWNSDVKSHEKGLENERRYAAIYWRDKGESETDDIGENLETDHEDEFEGPANWIAHKQQFFTSALIFENGMNIQYLKMSSDKADSSTMMAYESKFNLKSTNGNAYYDMTLYHGPNEYDILNDADIQLEEVIPYTWGIFGIFNNYFAHPILNFLSNYINNYGIIILILALCVKLLISPFTYKTYLSSLKMKVLKPELSALKEKFKDDKQAYQMEQMKFYRQAGVNPMGGCIPLLFQMPILFSMYRFFPSAIELRGQSFLWADDLASYDSFISWQADIWIFGNHLSLFTILMSATTLITTRMSSNQMPDQGNEAMARQMKIMQIAMPLIFIPVLNGFAAALSCYYLIMNLLTIVQQFLMKRFLINEDKIRAKIQLRQATPRKKSRFQQKLDEMMEQQEQMKKKK